MRGESYVVVGNDGSSLRIRTTRELARARADRQIARCVGRFWEQLSLQARPVARHCHCDVQVSPEEACAMPYGAISLPSTWKNNHSGLAVALRTSLAGIFRMAVYSTVSYSVRQVSLGPQYLSS